MSLTRKIAYNTLVQIIGKALGLFFSVITLGLLTRYLGPTLFGYHTTVFAFLQIFGILIDFGLQMITAQLISDPRYDERTMLSNIFTLRLCSAFAFFAAPLVALFFPYPPIVKIGIIITSLTYFFITSSTVLVGLFQKHFAMGKVALADFINKFLLFVFVAIGVALNKGLIWIFLITGVSNAVYFFLLLYFSYSIQKFKLAFDKTVWTLILSRSWPIALSIALNLVYFKADTLILSLTRTQNEVGLYGAPYKILEVMVNLSYLFLGLLLPVLTKDYAEKNMDRFRRILQKGFEVMVIAAIPLIVGTAVAGENIMVFIAGEDFIVSGGIAKILMIATGIIFVSAVFGYGVVAVNRQKQVLIFYAVNAAWSLVAYGIFIPRYSFWAAAWITVVSEMVILFSSLYILHKHTRFKPKLAIFLKTLFASIVMGAVLFTADTLNLASGYALIGTLLVCAFIYGACLYMVKGITKNTLVEIMKTK